VPHDPRERWQCIQWLFWQMSGLGPMAGQNHHFAHYAPDRLSYPTERYVKETGRLYAVLDKHLQGREFIVDGYSIADIACYPWIQPARQGQDIDDFPDLRRWREAIAARPATQRAYDIAKRLNVKPSVSDEESRKILFGQDRHTVRH
jgi:GST-like protein